MNGRIVDIKRFAVHDGPGIRTTVFLKGCNLVCIWCHNPEAILSRPELGYNAIRCINCGECIKVCPVSAHQVENGKHIFNRSICTGCGECAKVCLGDALIHYGREIDSQHLLDLVLEDRSFYEHSQGGVTLSGGEPLLQAAFCADFFSLAQESGIHTAIDTSGAVQWSSLAAVLPVTDLFLYDIKHLDPIIHQRLTGQGNQMILDNLRRLSDHHAKIEIRIPLLPGINDDDDHIQAVGSLLSQLQSIEKIRILPYHSLARSKYISLSKQDTMPNIESPTDEKLDQVAAILSSFGLNAISARK